MNIGDTYYYSGGMMTLSKENIVDAILITKKELLRARTAQAKQPVIDFLVESINDLRELRESLEPDQYELNF